MTRRARIVLERAVPHDLREEVAERLAHAAEHVSAHVLSSDGMNLDVEILDGAPTPATEEAVRQLIDGMTRRHREVEPVVVFEHRCSAPRPTAWDELAAKGLFALEGPGEATIAGDALDVLEALDGALTTIARRDYGARPCQYPTTLAIATLERCHYFASFPHHMTFGTHVRDNLGAIEQLSVARSEQHDLGALLAKPTHALSPAVCFHAYRSLADARLDENVTVTAKGHCFRHEAKNFATLERLWDFTLREVVFVGAADWVEERRQAWVRETGRFVEALGIDAWIETANDPFFATNFVAQRYFQRVSHTKYELRLALPYAPGRSLAAASFNAHREFFGRSFAIAHEGGWAHTACVGFGLERFVWALFAQLGPDIDAWPSRTRIALGLDGRT
jgi:seryl-tRNA synthetase